MASASWTEPRRRRSKGCDQCRRRRVKCDETTPICRQCLRFGYDCTGLVQGLMVVDMTADASSSSSNTPQNAQIKKNKKAVVKKSSLGQQSSIAARDSPTSSPASSTIVKLEESLKQVKQVKQENSEELVHNPVEARILSQPSNVRVLEQSLIKRFIVLSRPPQGPRNGSDPQRSWMAEVPSLLFHAKLPALKHAVRAAAMAFHTLLEPTRATRLLATQWYVAALGHHRAFLCHKQEQQRRNSSSVVKTIPSVEELLIPIFLCTFEMFLATGPTAIIQHRTAAEKVMKARGPELCQTGVPYQIFITVRVANACFTIITGQYGLYSTPVWLTVPFLRQEKSLFHQIIDVMLHFPRAIDVSGPIGMYELESRITKLESHHQVLTERCLELIDQLNDWWLRFEVDVDPTQPSKRYTSPESDTYTPSPKDQQSSFSSSPALSSNHPQQHFPSRFIYDSPMIAHTVSLYNLINVLLHTVLHLLFTKHSVYSPRDRAATFHGDLTVSHSTSILMIAKYQKQTRAVGSDFLTIMFTMKAVAALSPDLEQRKEASATVEAWAIFNGIKQVTAVR
ncbi:hypothetical protein BJ875DRAFT_132572 [Amylocarpus encephaloides]|uniref:Zn(2)-C6 fungal-type domain-containing protein n=1 Tax=Amylocarpus encephaloides TaxID=45428 RepID=A0A9P7YDA1_9HELO|nr:hypothetical protein BJ875DRAFT_132572 [Amylocarpus encephaloides]